MKLLVAALLVSMAFTTGFTCSKNTPQEPNQQEQTPPPPQDEMGAPADDAMTAPADGTTSMEGSTEEGSN